jgi:hypothetical protein
MSARFLGLVAIIGLFGVLTATALMEVGYLGIIAPHFRSWGAGQVLADLVIMCTLGCLWMIPDARARGINPLPYVVVVLFAGSFGVLFYLVARELRAGALQPASRQNVRG